MSESQDDKKKEFWKVLKIIMITFGIIIAVIVFVVFIISYILIKTVARPICGWGFLQMLLVLLPFVGDIAAYVIAVSGVGLPITGIILVIGAILETISSVCDFVNGNWIQGMLGIFGTIPIVGIVPQGLRGGTKLFSRIFGK